jgi:hypothetical protein
MLTAEEKAKLDAEFDAILAKHGYGTRAYRDAKARQAARPRVVVAGGEASAEVKVSPRDPNWREGPRPGFVVINMEALEREWHGARQREEWDRAQRAHLDPYNLGHWRPGR